MFCPLIHSYFVLGPVQQTQNLQKTALAKTHQKLMFCYVLCVSFRLNLTLKQNSILAELSGHDHDLLAGLLLHGGEQCVGQDVLGGCWTW